MKFRFWRPIEDGITLFQVKTEISIPEPLFNAAEQLAQRRGLSRNELYANALAAYVRDVETAPEPMTEARLNQVYATEDSSLDKSLEQMQSQTLATEKW